MAAPERDASWRRVQVSSKCSLEEQRAELALCHRTLSARPALVSRRSSRHSLQLLQQRPNPALRSHHQAPAYRLPRAGVHCTRCCAPCPPPTPHSLGRSCHEGSGRTEFFFSLSVTSSHLTFLRNEGCRQILKVFWHLKTRLGNQAFQRQPDCIFRH